VKHVTQQLGNTSQHTKSSLESDECNGSKHARCVSCSLHPCEQTSFYPNSVCGDYRTELTYEIKHENKADVSLVRFTCIKSGVTTKWFSSTTDSCGLELQTAEQLSCRAKDVLPYVIDVETEIGKIGSKETPIELTCLNDIENPVYAGRHVRVVAVVSSNSLNYQIPAEITAEVTTKDDEYTSKSEFVTDTVKKTIVLTDPVILSLIDVSLDTKEHRLKRMFKGKVSNLRIEKSYGVYFIRVRPSIHTIQQKDNKTIDEHGQEYKHYDIYIVTDKPLTFKSATKIALTGIPLPNPKTQRVTLLAYKVDFLDATENFDVKKLNQLYDKFNSLKTVQERWNWILDETCKYTQIIGRRNVAAAVYLAYFTPLQVSLNNDIQRGWGLVDIIGDSTTGKSETVKKIARHLNAGMVVSAETSSIAGILGASSQMDNGVWFVEWGCFPLMNGKLLAMDGCHKIPAWDWAKTAEAERDGILNINKAAKATIPAHTRQIKIYNAVDKETNGYPTKQLSEFLYPIQAYLSVADPTIIARRDFAIFVNSRDVTAEQINKTHIIQTEPEYDLLREALKWCWNGKTDVTITDEALIYLHNKATELYNTFHYASIPLVSADMKFKLARLSTALAYLTLSVCNDYKTVTVTKEHVEVIVNFLIEEYTKAGLNILAQTSKFETLTIEDVTEFFIEIEAKLQKDPIGRCVICEILKSVVLNGRATADQLKTSFNLTENNQRRPLLATLQTLGLTKHGRGGIYPTPKLIEAYKITGGFTALNELTPLTPSKTVSPNIVNQQRALGYDICNLSKNVNSLSPELSHFNNNVFSVKGNQQQKIVSQEPLKDDGYQQLACGYCQKGIMDNDWLQNDFTNGKPTHRQCYDIFRNQLKQSSETPALEENASQN